MRLQRFGLIFLAVFVAFIGASAYYYTVFPIRILTHIVLTICFAAWLIRRMRRGVGLPKTALNLPLFALVGVWALSILVAQDPRMALESAWLPFINVLIYFFIAAMFRSGAQRLAFETQFMLATLAVIMAAVQFGSFLFGWGITPETVVGWLETGRPPISPQLYLPLGVSTWLAAYVTPLALVSFAWSLTARRNDERWVLRILAALLLLTLVGTFSRGGFLALGVSLLIFGGLQLYAPLRKRFGAAALLLPAGAVVAFVAVILIIGRNPGRLSGDELRLNLWQSAVKAIQERPALGYGIGGFGRAAREFRDPARVDDRLGTAHNILLNTTAETGIPGAVVLIWIAGTVVVCWWRLRRNADSAYQIRLDAALAALAALAVQSMVDLFTATPIVMLAALLAAYCVIPLKLPDGKRLREGKNGVVEMAAAGAALVIVLGYGLFWIQSDRAQAAFGRSVRNGDLEAAQEAAAIDPGLHLYPLQIAYLTGLDAHTPEQIAEAIQLYEAGLALEPTWDTGWINLAALYERTGQIEQAVNALEQAAAFNSANAAGFNLARLREEYALAPEDEIVAGYLTFLERGGLPFSGFWQGTALRQDALEAYYAEANPELQYRIAEGLFPERLDEIDGDGSAWIEAMRAADAETAVMAMDRAVSSAPNYGDYAAARAQVMIPLLRDNATLAEFEFWLKRAQALRTVYELPDRIRLEAAQALNLPFEQLEPYLLGAVPPRILAQNFEGVLFGGRTAAFMLYPEMQLPGPGYSYMEPWYLAAAHAESVGDTERARELYRAILDYAPDERAAAERLAALEQN